MKALSLLHSFAKSDWHWFEKYLKSPAFNQNNFLLTIFTRIKGKKSNLTQLSKNFFSGFEAAGELDTAEQHRQANYFLKSVEGYWAWDEWSQDTTAQMFSLLRACQKRGAEQHFQTVQQRLSAHLEQQALRDPAYYRAKHGLMETVYQQLIETGRTDMGQLQALSDLQDVAFVAEKLRNGCMMLSWQKVLRSSFSPGLLPAVLEFVQARPQLLEHTAVAVYYYGYMALSKPEEEEAFFALKNLLPHAGTCFEGQELRDVYLLAINFCINRINLRQEQYQRALLDLYKDGLGAGVFLEKGHISRFTYTNIALLALRMHEFDWVKQFIETYRTYLHEAHADTYAFNLARYYCQTGDYDRAMPMLQTVDFDDILYQLMAKAMLLRMYYDTGAIAALESLLASFGTFVRRKRQVPVQQRTAYLNTIRLVRKLIALRPGNRKMREALRQEAAETALIAEKDWLMEKLNAGVPNWGQRANQP